MIISLRQMQPHWTTKEQGSRMKAAAAASNNTHHIRPHNNPLCLSGWRWRSSSLSCQNSYRSNSSSKSSSPLLCSVSSERTSEYCVSPPELEAECNGIVLLPPTNGRSVCLSAPPQYDLSLTCYSAGAPTAYTSSSCCCLSSSHRILSASSAMCKNLRLRFPPRFKLCVGVEKALTSVYARDTLARRLSAPSPFLHMLCDLHF